MRKRPDTNFIGLLLGGGLAGYGAWYLRGWLETDMLLFPAMLAIFAVLSAIKLVFMLLGLIPRAIRHARAHRTTGKGGTAGWETERAIKKAGFFKRRNGFFAALSLRGRAMFINLESSGLVLSPAGGGKTVSFVIPALLHVDSSMLVPDLKGTLSAMTIRHRRDRLGHAVDAINPTGRYEDILGPSAAYNMLQILIDNWNLGRHEFILADARAWATQFCPEPPRTTENVFFRNASRNLLTFAFVYLVIMGLDATLTGAYVLLRSRRKMIDAIEMACSTDYLNGDLAGEADDIRTKIAQADPRQLESFFEGAVQALRIYAPSGPFARCTGHSSVRFSDLRKEKRTLYILGDPTRPDETRQFMGDMMFAAKMELLRETAGERVVILADEATNFRANGFPSLMTLAREYKIAIWVIIQELSEWSAVYGPESLDTLLSQTEVKIIYGVRSHKTCQLISDMLGEKSVVSRGHNIGVDVFDPVTRSLSEGSRRLLTPDEVRRFEDAIIFARGMRPIRGQRIGYHEVSPWCSWAGVNPLFGRKYVGKVRLRLRY